MRGSSVQRVLDRAVAAAALGLAGAGVLCVIAMMIVVTFEVVSRYLLNSPTMWSDEIASYLLIAIVFLGLAQNLRLGDHIRVDVITEKLPARARRWFELFAYALGLVFSIMLLVGVWIRFQNFWMRHTLSDSPLMTPLWIPMVPVLLGALILVPAMLAGLMSTAHAVFGGAHEDPSAPPRV